KSQLKNKINKLTDDKQYSQEIENLWKDFKQLFDKKIELNPDFSFNKMVMEIHELLAEGKEAIQEWVNKEKKKELEIRFLSVPKEYLQIAL
ncbi:10983_t:CDS:2, partial [Funneliformis geosporum]